MKAHKYIGGSRLVSFRLPINGYKSTRARVQALLDQIAHEMNLEAQNSAKPLSASAKTTLTDRTQLSPITYVCGCSIEDGLFKRGKGCALDRNRHTPAGSRLKDTPHPP